MIGQCTFATGGPAIRAADLVIGDTRHLRHVATLARSTEVLRVPFSAGLDSIATHVDAGRRVCLLASGDPGFFGTTRALVTRLGSSRVTVHPAPSSVSLAFARIGLPWDDATVISAHGRPFDDAVTDAISAAKLAVLTGPDMPPETVGARMLEAGCGPRQVTVCSRLGETDEDLHVTDLHGLAAGTFDPLAVVIVLAGSGFADGPQRRWADPFAHRAGMITKSEVRAVVVSKLDLPPTGVFWDVGAGSGSVAIDAAHLAPGLRVLAVEHNAADARRIRDNAEAHVVDIETVEGTAPAVLSGLPDPDRAFVGGGGLDVLDEVWRRTREGGVVVATFASIGRAAAAARLLGEIVQISVGRGVPIGAGGEVRLAAENPVFVCSGTKPATSAKVRSK